MAFYKILAFVVSPILVLVTSLFISNYVSNNEVVYSYSGAYRSVCIKKTTGLLGHIRFERSFSADGSIDTDRAIVYEGLADRREYKDSGFDSIDGKVNYISIKEASWGFNGLKINEWDLDRYEDYPNYKKIFDNADLELKQIKERFSEYIMLSDMKSN